MNGPDSPHRPTGAVPGAPRFAPHTQRAAVLAEVHARPFRPAGAPRVFLHYAFAVERERFEADRRFLDELCRSRGEPGPAPDARHHVVAFAGGGLQWERHAEFVTYSWDGPAPDAAVPFAPLPAEHPFGPAFVAPGPLVVAARLDLLGAPAGADEAARHFDPASLCISLADDGRGVALTDFRQDGDGRTRILLLDRGLTPAQAGSLVQRLLEIETYRTLAMLGLPVAQALAPEVLRIEHELAAITAEIRSSEGLVANHGLLQRLSELTADLEAHAAASSYRLGAARAYDQIVKDRLSTLHEAHAPGHGTWSDFLARRSEPALRTVQGILERMEDLSRKLARAAQLLRTRVEIDLEHQNRDLLESMNRRSRQSLLLQTTVEGLSVAAVSYYIVALASYVFKALKEAHVLGLDPGIATGLAVPVVLAAVFVTIQRIHRAYVSDAGGGH